MLARRYGLDREPNFEGRHWHLHACVAEEDIATELGLMPATVSERLQSGLSALHAIREKRVRPGRDEKILTSWNGLMIRGLAIAARALARPDLEQDATRAVDFLQRDLWRDGRLLASHKDGHSRHAGYLDDYAFLADGLLELLQTRWRPSDLQFAVALAEALLTHFEDIAAGGFWFTAHDAEGLITRSKTFADEALPAGNGIAARVLQRLGYLLGESRYLDAATRTLAAGWRQFEHTPHAHASLLDALEEHLDPPEIVILRGPAAVIGPWHRELARLYAPRRLVLAIPEGAEALPASLATKPSMPGGLAYVCKGSVCETPIDTLSALIRRLRDGIGMP